MFQDLIPIYCWQYHHFFFFVCHLMAMSSTCYNPFLYGWYNESFQKEFVQVKKPLEANKLFAMKKNKYLKMILWIRQYFASAVKIPIWPPCQLRIPWKLKHNSIKKEMILNLYRVSWCFYMVNIYREHII